MTRLLRPLVHQGIPATSALRYWTMSIPITSSRSRRKTSTVCRLALLCLRVRPDFPCQNIAYLLSATARPTLTRAQRARIGVLLNRRQPSEQDYEHFILYRTNQKAYEATFLKHFINYALHIDQVEKCFRDGVDSQSRIKKYMASVSANINGITNKMIWYAHCRTVNLPNNAGKDCVPFWDVAHFDRSIFAGFEPDITSFVAHKMSESWHRTAPEPAMVRYTAKDYPIGYHSSPLEEVDEVADTLFRCEAFRNALPAGRTIKIPMTRRGKGRGLPGASIRDPKMS